MQMENILGRTNGCGLWVVEVCTVIFHPAGRNVNLLQNTLPGRFTCRTQVRLIKNSHRGILMGGKIARATLMGYFNLQLISSFPVLKYIC